MRADLIHFAEYMYGPFMSLSSCGNLSVSNGEGSQWEVEIHDQIFHFEIDENLMNFLIYEEIFHKMFSFHY